MIKEKGKEKKKRDHDQTITNPSSEAPKTGLLSIEEIDAILDEYADVMFALADGDDPNGGD